VFTSKGTALAGAEAGNTLDGADAEDAAEDMRRLIEG